ncbi:glycosyltransferase family 2 protein [Aeromicrobium sp. Root472D3]|uniref:glycosyltransferase family 2 protein n=1 Tax=Aeromicrobium sp. Root472D3 TaxID=1736540 RepID=UPI0006FCFA36|nr:glycosyltransferase family 2 protein [Aeromicrobium sp. Root472D3]KQX74271.1 hypothetical protein ASD10_03215 [Aeromicrobium sp. Root472D3]
MTLHAAIVIPNLNGGDALLDAIDSLVSQDPVPQVVVVDNASTDGSISKVRFAFPSVHIIENSTNRGYAGGVNPGVQWALGRGFTYVGVFNDDAVAQRGWLQELATTLAQRPDVGVATSKVLSADGTRLDSAGDCFTTWGLAFPRGRGEVDDGRYDSPTDVFGASGAACLFRADTLRAVGLFDEDFFAYFEDIDLSFRIRHAGWQITYCPKARVHHVMGMTSSRSHGFTTHQTMKNLPLVLYRNVPTRLLCKIAPRFVLSQLLLTCWAFRRHQGRAALTGHGRAVRLLVEKRKDRENILSTSVLSLGQIEALMVPDFPPHRPDLDLLRAVWRKASSMTNRNTRDR